MKEEMRTIGYLCPACHKRVIQQRSVFALSASGAVVSCECGESSLTIEAEENKFRLSVPCGVCGEEHLAECSADKLLHGRGIGLACPDTKMLCCFIGEAFGGTVSYAKTLFHGKQSEVTHCLDGVFTGIDTPVKVARYHSLAVLRDDLPECLKVTAQTADGEIMAMRHKEYPVVGLQFHPESIYTEHGKRMIENFLSGVI